MNCPLAAEVEVKSHSFNKKTLWALIRSEAQSDDKVIFKGKKKDLLKPIIERTLDIVYKCLESRVAGVDDVNVEKIGIQSAILSNIKCDWAKHIYNRLEYYVVEVDVKEGDEELFVNVRYGFMIAYPLKLKRVSLKAGSKVHPHTYLFRTTIKKSKKGRKFETTATERSVSSNAPLSKVAEKA